MKEDLIFFERQRFSQWWFIILLACINGLLIYGSVIQIGLGQLWGNHSLSNTGLLIITVSMLLLTVGFFFIRLDTMINEEGVYVRMFPLQLSSRFFYWEQISDYRVSKMNPIKDFGGMGVRFSIINIGTTGIRYGIGTTSYTMSGNKVLQLTLDNNKRIYIGTQRPNELSEFLEKLDAERKQK